MSLGRPRRSAPSIPDRTLQAIVTNADRRYSHTARRAIRRGSGRCVAIECDLDKPRSLFSSFVRPFMRVSATSAPRSHHTRGQPHPEPLVELRMRGSSDWGEPVVIVGQIASACAAGMALAILDGAKEFPRIAQWMHDTRSRRSSAPRAKRWRLPTMCAQSFRIHAGLGFERSLHVRDGRSQLLEYIGANVASWS